MHGLCWMDCARGVPAGTFTERESRTHMHIHTHTHKRSDREMPACRRARRYQCRVGMQNWIGCGRGGRGGDGLLRDNAGCMASGGTNASCPNRARGCVRRRSRCSRTLRRVGEGVLALGRVLGIPKNQAVDRAHGRDLGVEQLRAVARERATEQVLRFGELAVLVTWPLAHGCAGKRVRTVPADAASPSGAKA